MCITRIYIKVHPILSLSSTYWPFYFRRACSYVRAYFYFSNTSNFILNMNIHVVFLFFLVDLQFKLVMVQRDADTPLSVPENPKIPESDLS